MCEYWCKDALHASYSKQDTRSVFIQINEMEKFTTIQSTAVPLNMEDVDTDQIIPARFLKATTREGFGDNLFRDWRYNNDNTLREDFILNNKSEFI